MKGCPRLGLFGAVASMLISPVAGADEPEVAAGDLRFRVHRIDSFPGGYQVSVADMNGDGRPDILGLAQNPAALVWYQNPAWTRHAVPVEGKNFIDAVAQDADGDGRLDVALATDFNLARADTGQLHLVRRAPGAESWSARLIATEPTIHRLRWADVDGDRKKELVAVPILGPGATAPEYAVPAPLLLFRLPDWKRTVIDQQNHMVHGVRIVEWDTDRGEEILTASFEGVFLYRWRSSEKRWERTRLGEGDQRPGPKRGASEVAVGHLTRAHRFLATVEPWHGHQLVTYRPPTGPGLWRRQVIDDTLVDAHALATGDLDGDGRDEIVAGYRGQGRRLLLYRATDTTATAWKRTVLDDGDMATSGVVLADLNQDGRLDIVAVGSASANINWYENLQH